MQPPAEAAWSRDLRVIQTEPSRSRISSSLASIESQLRSGALNAGPEGGQVVHGTVQLVYALVFGTFGKVSPAVGRLLRSLAWTHCTSRWRRRPWVTAMPRCCGRPGASSAR